MIYCINGQFINLPIVKNCALNLIMNICQSRADEVIHYCREDLLLLSKTKTPYLTFQPLKHSNDLESPLEQQSGLAEAPIYRTRPIIIEPG